VTKYDDLPPLAQDLLRERFFDMLRHEWEEDDALQEEITSCFLQLPHIVEDYNGYKEQCWEIELNGEGVDDRWDEWLREHAIEP
jgi:hypothetical protein